MCAVYCFNYLKNSLGRRTGYWVVNRAASAAGWLRSNPRSTTYYLWPWACCSNSISQYLWLCHVNNNKVVRGIKWAIIDKFLEQWTEDIKHSNCWVLPFSTFLTFFTDKKNFINIILRQVKCWLMGFFGCVLWFKYRFSRNKEKTLNHLMLL